MSQASERLPRRETGGFNGLRRRSALARARQRVRQADGLVSAIVLCGALAAGCAGLLPKEESASATPWSSFDSALATYERIAPFESTVDDLKELGLDPYGDPNIAILNYADLLRKFIGTSSIPFDALDADLRECLSDGASCRGFEIDVKHVERKREGSFWLDFLTFRRTTNVTGWRFNAVIVLRDDRVVYKLWSGQPAIREVEKDTRPLGPLQNIGESLRPH